MGICPNCNKETFRNADAVYVHQSKGNIDVNMNFCNWECLFHWLNKKLKESV